jgi:hypothetical protein
MCLSTPKVTAAPQIIAASDNAEAIRQADLEATLRRRRAGAAANVLTSARGIPSTPKLGSAA